MQEKGVHVIISDKHGRIALVQKSVAYAYDTKNAGKISMFGGRQEESETDAETAYRELQEELSVVPDTRHLERLCVLYKTKAIDGVDVEVVIFKIQITDVEALDLLPDATAGNDRDCNMSIVRGTIQELRNRPGLTRITRLALEVMNTHIKNVSLSTSNVAYIDGQNLHKSTAHSEPTWLVDLARFRVYLQKKYNIDHAYYFIGFYQEGAERAKLYERIQKAGFILKFRKHSEAMVGAKKGNVDTDIIFTMMVQAHEPNFGGRIVLVSGDGDYYAAVDFLVHRNQFEKLLFPNRKFISSLYKKLGSHYLSCLADPGVKEKIETKEKGSLGS